MPRRQRLNPLGQTEERAQFARAHIAHPVLTARHSEIRYPALFRQHFVDSFFKRSLSDETVHQHIALLTARKEKLNALRFKSLHYTNSLGTDLTIELPDDHLWAAGNSETPAGVGFVANLPTEEIFTAPLKMGANGTVCAALPLVNNGSIIEDIRFTVREGRIVEAKASRGEDVLNAAIAVDDGARYFGEVALVPYDSPISNQKILFYNTLFDENAACHLAFGEAYPECVEGGEAMSKEELKAAGLNSSNTHVDFMIGTSDLSIIGTTKDGREIPVFVNGNFAL